MSLCIVAWAVVFVVASLVALGAYDHLAAGWTRRNRHHGPRDEALGGGSQTWAPDDRDEDGATPIVVALLLPVPLAVVLATIDLGRPWQWLTLAAVAAAIATYELTTRTPKPKPKRRRRRR